MTRILVAVVLLLGLPAFVSGDVNIPDPSQCSVTPCDDLGGIVLSPDDPADVPACHVTIVVLNALGEPVPDAVIAVQAFDETPFCHAAPYVVIADAEGVAHIVLDGGGCFQGQWARVKANGITIRNYDSVKSPDWDGAGADRRVDLADLIAFSDEFLGVAGGCHDYDNSGATNLGDLITFAQAFAGSNRCP